MQTMSVKRFATAVKCPKVSRAYVLRLVAFFVVSFIVGLYLEFSPRCNYEFFCQKVLFRAHKCDKLTAATLGTRGQEVSFIKKDGSRLSGVYFAAPHDTGNNITVLRHHGMAGDLNAHAGGCEELSNRMNVAVLAYDYSGFGKSEGVPSLAGLPDDARAAYDFLVSEKHARPELIVHFGASLGTGPATVLAAEKPCAGLALFAPYTSIKSAARDALPFLHIYPDVLITEADLETLQNIRNVHAPLLLMHGDKDNTIRVHNGDEIFAAANEPKEFLRVKGGDHFGSDFGVIMDKKSDEFIRKLQKSNNLVGK